MRFFLIAAAAVSLVAAAPTAADNPQLVGSVGPGFVISLTSGGAPVTHLDTGTYTLVVHDLADVHNFHLFGPGSVNVATDVEGTGDKTFTVTLSDGIYDYVCDAHATMHGRFAVGSAQLPVDTTPAPTTPRKLSLRVSASGRVTAPAHLSPGRYVVTATDASSAENVHLKGAGVDRKTGATFKGTAHWAVTLKRGSYRAFSDAHRRLARTIAVS